MTYPRLISTPLLVLLIAVTSSGCFGSQELSRVQAQFERDHPDAQFQRDVSISAGPLTLSSILQLTRLGEVSRLQPLVRSIEGVKLGVYSIEGELASKRYTPDFLDQLMNRGWVITARHMNPPEQSWLLYNARGEQVRDFYIVRLDEDQLVVVRLRGNMERIIATILSENDWNVDARALTLIP